jgi:hypothetical protein
VHSHAQSHAPAASHSHSHSETQIFSPRRVSGQYSTNNSAYGQHIFAAATESGGVAAY